MTDNAILNWFLASSLALLVLVNRRGAPRLLRVGWLGPLPEDAPPGRRVEAAAMSSSYHEADGHRKNIYARIPDAVALERDRPCLNAHAWEEWAHEDERKADKVRRINLAKAACNSCPVLGECRDWALTLPDPVDQHVAGGLTTAERRGWRKRNEPIRHGTSTGWRQHTHRGDPPCDPCTFARNDYLRQIAILKKECA